MAGKLVVEEGDLKGLSLSLDEGESWTIGRDAEECQFTIEDPLVSRRHLLIRRTPEGMTIENLSVTNPAQVNDEEINEQPRLLQNGDAVKIGNEMLRYYTEASAHVVEEEASRLIEAVRSDQPDVFVEEAGSEASAEIFTAPESVKIADEPPPSVNPKQSREEPGSQPSIFEEEVAPDAPGLAEIDFGVVDTGRWLLKVIGGPNNGAEFHMQAGNTYLVGTDPKSCDIVFYDNSVSRQHAKIIVTPEDTLTIEDLRSKNGVLINGALIEGQQPLSLSTIVTLGTTSFVIYDREGEMQTIISPLLPSIVKVLQQEPPKNEEAPDKEAVESELEEVSSQAPPVPQPKKSIGPYVVLAAIIGLFVVAGIGTTTLFRSEPIVEKVQENADELIKKALKTNPAVRFSFDKSSGSLLLIGHIKTAARKQQLVYDLKNLKFIKEIDDKGVVIDDFVTQEMNSILGRNPAWKGIALSNPLPGRFVLSGYLQTRKQAEQLSSYISSNFAYLDLLKNRIIVEEDVINQIAAMMDAKQLTDVVTKMDNGEVILSGAAPADKANDITEVIGKIKKIPGVRLAINQVKTQTAETGIINISDKYHVSGKSRIGEKFTVIINGRILSENDDLDGMTIKKISTDRIILEKEGIQYRIDLT